MAQKRSPQRERAGINVGINVLNAAGHTVYRTYVLFKQMQQLAPAVRFA